MMEDEEARQPEKLDSQSIQLDALADFHARLSRCETFDVSLSRRVTALEDAARGRSYDDPMAGFMPIVWLMALASLAPVIADLMRQWRAPAGGG